MPQIKNEERGQVPLPDLLLRSARSATPFGWSTPEEAWRGTFTLIPVNTVPDFYPHSWATFPNGRFDLSRSVPIPPISPDFGDRFYRVQVRSESQWVDQGWMWLTGRVERTQEWYGRNLTSDLLVDGLAIRFTSAEPPAPGSNVYLLIDRPLS